MTATTDGLLIGIYLAWPFLWIVFRGDKKPAKTERATHEHL
jgi:hypothetical protein